MKTKTKIGAGISTVLVAIMVVFMAVQSFAADPIYLNITDVREGNDVYIVTHGTDGPGNPNNSEIVWKIVSFSGKESTDADYTLPIYCVQPKIGMGSYSSGPNAENEVYDTSFDMKESALDGTFQDVLGTIYGNTLNTTKYNSILWVLDHMYLPKYTPAADRAKMKQLLFDEVNEFCTGMDEDLSLLTDNDIEVVQQMALWYFTTDPTDTEYHYDYSDSEYFPSIKLNGQDMETLIDSDRYDAMYELYYYFVKSALDNNTIYGGGIKRNLVEPSFVFTEPADNAETTVETIGTTDYYVSGPYKIKDNNNSPLPYTIDLSVKDQNNSTIANAKILDSSLSVIDSIDSSFIEKNVNEEGEEFYIAVPTSNTTATKIKLNVDIEYFTTGATFWISSEEIVNNECQPVVIPTRTKVPVELEKETKIVRPEFDLALRKFITQINGANVEVSREPQVDVSKLNTIGSDNKPITTAKYTHPKNALKVKTGDLVTYTIRVYNEGDIDGYAKEITEHIPEGLELANDDASNAINLDTYGWTVDPGNDRIITTNYLSREVDEDNLIAAFDKDTMVVPDYRDVQIILKVTEPNSSKNTLVNIAEISDDSDANGGPIDDRDSQPGNVDTEHYNPPADNSTYQQDDDDYEPLVLAEFDLALRKFITAVNGEEMSSRIPQVDASKLDTIGSDNKKITTAKYEHPKDPVLVETGDKVTYTIRIYNEGEVSGYAEQIVDDIPEGLAFLPTDQTNIDYNWKMYKEITVGAADIEYNGKSYVETNNAQEAKIIVTDYLSRGRDAAENLIHAYNPDTMGEPEHQDVKVVFEVTEPNDSERTLINTAEIGDDADELGNETEDRDSTPGNGVINEDDIDKEYLKLKSDKEFDLALRKFITQINGTDVEVSRKPQVDVDDLKTGHVQTATYTHPKNALKVKTGDKVTYTLRIYNEGDIDGYAKEITEHIPEGLVISRDAEDAEINNKWVSENERTAKTNFLSRESDEDNLIAKFDKDTMNEPDYKEVQIVLKVTEPISSKRTLVNIAEISNDSDANGGDVGDRDSTPGNVDLDNYELREENSTYQQDDDDYEPLVLAQFDLALRKFITEVNGTEITVSREPQVDASALINDETVTTATYNHPKDPPVFVKTGDKVTYTIRIYNEGEVSGYAEEITDDIPAGLKFIEGDPINDEYHWHQEGNKITTDYLSRFTDPDNLIAAFDTDTMGEPEYRDVKIVFEVTEPNDSNRVLVNTAEISDDADEDGNPVDDRDSTPKNNIGEEDDIDKEYLRLEDEKKFDLALRKFITEVNGTELTESREPEVTKESLNKLAQGTVKTATYVHPKNPPVSVKNGDKVTYTIRIYNEGQISGYAERIIDDIPEGLAFLPENETNEEYNWKMYKQVEVGIPEEMISYNGKHYVETNNVLDAEIIATDYLSRERDAGGNLIDAYNPNEMTTLAYKDVKVVFDVIEPNSSKRILVNTAEIGEDADEDGNPVDDRDSIPGDNVNSEDDIDKEYVKLEEKPEEFDLALRKFITEVNGAEPTESREPKVDASKLNTIGSDGKKITTATYTHPKNPVLVKTGDKVIYTIRVYNEGEVAGYAEEITDNIPEGLKFIEDEVNEEYGWILSEDETKITTNYLSKEFDEDNLIPAFDPDTMEEPAHKDVKVAFEVIEPNTSKRTLINIAEISEDADEDGKPVEDRDSTPDNNKPEEDDIDKEYVKLQDDRYFDLALRKFITDVNSKEVTTRYPKVTLKDGKLTYNHSKDPVLVANGDIVTYTIRVYNEGEIAGYAKEVTDDIPEGLAYLPKHETNIKYGWVASKDGKSVTTDYLSKEKSDERKEDNLIKAFDKSAAITDSNPDYREVKIAFKVTETNIASNRIIINTAEISDDSDEDGKDVKDKDSTPGDGVKPSDDIDEEYLKVKYFDLSLLKWVSKAIVTENGETTVTESGHTGLENPEPVVKVDLDRKRLDEVTVKFEYVIQITNEGEIEGYAKEISDYIPEGLKFVKADNPDWEEKDGKIVTRKLENTLLKPGEKATVTVILTWVNDENNMGEKVNVAEISEDYNEYNSKDKDSTPNNKREKEDDIDDAPVLLTVKTGIEPSYVFVVLGCVSILTAGMVLIKKFVL